MMTPEEMIAELERLGTGPETSLAILVVFRESDEAVKTIYSTDTDRAERLAQAIRDGGIPVGIIVRELKPDHNGQVRHTLWRKEFDEHKDNPVMAERMRTLEATLAAQIVVGTIDPEKMLAKARQFMK